MLMRKTDPKKAKAVVVARDYVEKMARLWALRILVDAGAWRKLDGIFEDDLLMCIGMPDLFETNRNSQELLKVLKDRKFKIEAMTAKPTGCFHRNIKRLAGLVGLSETETQVLAFTAILTRNSGLSDAGSKLGSLSIDRLVNVLAIVLRYPRGEIRNAISVRGMLVRSGLLRREAGNGAPLSAHLAMMSGLADGLFDQCLNAADLLRAYFLEVESPELGPKDFSYIRKDLDLLSRYLKVASKEKRVGVNILMHGAPGTGKSQLAKVIGKKVGTKVFEINMTSYEGDSLAPRSRFDAYQLAQQVLARRPNSLLMFDEVEDVFPAYRSPFRSFEMSSGNSKAWINRQLENNQVPAIWISNSISEMDPAYIRRFDYVLELGYPPREIRKSILKNHLKTIPVSDDWVARASSNPGIAPGIITRAAKVACAASNDAPGAVEQTLDRVLTNTLSAMGMKIEDSSGTLDTTPYRLDILNADLDVSAMLAALKRHPHGRLCLYGPPGTGKTAFGRHVAEQLDMPLVVKRASDLLDKYIGATEQKIAAMFNQARNERAVLMLDEADSFLRDRGSAMRSWEVTQVNELLTQMERFEGLFLCSTNLMDALDPASIRRFDFKVKLDYLEGKQAWVLFKEVLKDQGLPVPESQFISAQVSRLDNLTPGDFATVVRQSRLIAEGLTADGLYQGLLKESRFKADARPRQIGFTAQI